MADEHTPPLDSATAITTTSTSPLPARGDLLHVTVEAALPEIIVVSLTLGKDTFRGALLVDNRKLPPGVDALNPCLRPIEEDEKLYSVGKRFEYRFGKDRGPAKGHHKKAAKMTVRLRPRKVLCSNCRGICNENEQNVAGNGRAAAPDRKVYLSSTSVSGRDRGAPPPTRNTRSRRGDGEPLRRNEVWLKSERPTFDDGDAEGEPPEDDDEGSDTPDSSSDRNSENRFTSSDRRDGESAPAKAKGRPAARRPPEEEGPRRKRRADDRIPRAGDESAAATFSSARTLKISFGEGEGTVVKLPAIVGDAEESAGDVDDKAAKKALRKAKKRARKRTASPSASSSPSRDRLRSPSKKRRRRVKHKKRRREDRKSRSVDGRSESDPPSADENRPEAEERRPKRRPSEESNGDREPDLANGSRDSDAESENRDGSESANAVDVVPGDVVWGKLQGFSWWPGRVLALRCGDRAQVAWYASSASSTMPRRRLDPFLDGFKVRYDRKKKGPYREAVRLASLEARSGDPLATDPLATHMTPLSSPPIDVLS